MTTATIEAPAAAPAASAAPAAPAAAPKAPESLFKPAEATAAPTPGAAPAAPAAPADELAWLPAKFRVMDAEGKLDLAASSKKLGEGYTNAEKRIGTAASAPETPDGYEFTPPEELKDVQLDDGLAKAFRERAHKAGLSQEQYSFVMGEYFGLVPALLDAKASHTAEQARAELSKVWATPADLEANMSAAEQAVRLAPQALQQQLREKYGTDPVFWQFAAHYGKQMREDTPPANGATPAAGNVDALMKSEAYSNPKHPDHARVSEQVRTHFEKRYGSTAAM